MNKWMKKCLDLASLAQGDTAPNPMVGALLVCQDTILCQGFHKGPGKWHAERDALLQLSMKKVPQNAVLYVNLEPCCVHGRTPPCTDIIISKGIRKVVVGMLDPDPRMAGKGIKVLQDAGIKVVIGIEEEACKEHNRAYLMARKNRRPWIRLKAGISLDGKIASYFGESKWITSSLSRQHTHTIRNVVDGILVGKNTVLSDNPSLTTRLSEDILPFLPQKKIHHPRPIVISTTGLSASENTLSIFNHPCRPLVFSNVDIQSEKFDTIVVNIDDEGRLNLSEVLEEMVKQGIYDVLVEGGGQVHRSFLKAGHFDELYLYIGPKILGAGTNWVAHLPRHLDRVEELQLWDVKKLGNDVVLHYRNPKSYNLYA